MDFSKIKDNKALKIGLIIALPTVLVAAYYGYKYVKKKNFFIKEDKPKNNLIEEVDTTGMQKYDIMFPFNLDLTSKIYEKIININYSFLNTEVITDSNGNMITVIHIMAKPSDTNLIKEAIKTVTPNADIVKADENK